MWPPHAEAIEQTLAAEQAIEDAYAEALRRWAPQAMAAVLPAFRGTVITADGSELPPDPQAIASTQSAWDELIAGTVLPVVAAVWADAAGAAAAVNTVGGGVEGIVSALAGARDDYLQSYGLIARAIPIGVSADLSAIIRESHPISGGLSPTTSQLRIMVRDAITPGSALLRKTSRRLGYTGASILNHALLSVAKHAGKAERKTWISRRDDRVRPTHRVADGQTVPIDANFHVDGVEMPFPGSPSAPLRETAGCRCHIVVLGAGQEPKLWLEDPIAASAGGETTMTAPVTEVPRGVEQANGEMFRTFTDATIAFIGIPTSDRRVLAKNINLTYRSMPRPLMWMRHTGDGGHVDAFTVGVIESSSHDGERVIASGYLLNTPEADEAALQLEHGVTRPSVDLGGAEWMLTDENGNEISEEQWWDMPLDAKVFHTFTAAELMGMTLVATPAFGETAVILNEMLEPREPSMLAAAEFKPTVYPASHFADPQLSEPTLPMMLDGGRVVGHVACWGQCHRSVQTACVQAPRSPSAYAHFHTSPPVLLDDGARLPVGRLTVGTGHADPRMGGQPAAAHYDHTGTCWALVRAGEDAHGIWISGVAAPWATPAQIQAGLASPLSGDWRDFGQGLDLVAALAVNTPGFAARGRTGEHGQPTALVAALGPRPVWEQALTRDDVKTAVFEALSEAKFNTERDELLARAKQWLAPLDSDVEPVVPKTPDEEIDELLAEAGI